MSTEGPGRELLTLSFEKEEFPHPFDPTQALAPINLGHSPEPETVHSDTLITSTTHQGPEAQPEILLGSSMGV